MHSQVCYHIGPPSHQSLIHTEEVAKRNAVRVNRESDRVQDVVKITLARASEFDDRQRRWRR